MQASTRLGQAVGGAPGPCALADQTRVLPARLHGPLQQQIHHHLCQVAARPSLPQRGRVVKGSHVVLRRKTVSKPCEFLVCKDLTGHVRVTEGKGTSQVPLWGCELPERCCHFPEVPRQRVKQRQPFWGSSSRFAYSGSLLTLRAGRGRGTTAGCRPSALPPPRNLARHLGTPRPLSAQAFYLQTT